MRAAWLLAMNILRYSPLCKIKDFEITQTILNFQCIVLVQLKDTALSYGLGSFLYLNTFCQYLSENLRNAVVGNKTERSHPVEQPL